MKKQETYEMPEIEEITKQEVKETKEVDFSDLYKMTKAYDTESEEIEIGLSKKPKFINLAIYKDDIIVGYKSISTNSFTGKETYTSRDYTDMENKPVTDVKEYKQDDTYMMAIICNPKTKKVTEQKVYVKDLIAIKNNVHRFDVVDFKDVDTKIVYGKSSRNTVSQFKTTESLGTETHSEMYSVSRKRIYTIDFFGTELKISSSKVASPIV